MIAQIKNEIGDQPFKELVNIILGILFIVHNNVEFKWVFSKVKEIQTEFRPLLSNDNLENLLLVKNNFTGNYFD